MHSNTRRFRVHGRLAILCGLLSTAAFVRRAGACFAVFDRPGKNLRHP